MPTPSDHRRPPKSDQIHKSGRCAGFFANDMPARREDVSALGEDWPMTTPIPAALAEPLDGEARPQSPFPWTKQPWLDQMHDCPDVLSLLDRLPERVSRQSTP